MKRVNVFLTAVVLSACGPEVREPDPVARSQVPLVATPPAYAGYQHTFTKTGFVVGGNPHSVKENGFDKVVGDVGVFAKDSVNGAILATPNGASGREQAEPLTGDAEVHNKAVLDYFASGGIPMDQVAGVDVTTEMSVTGPEPDGRDGPAQFVAYTSVLQRRVAGIPVADSLASARLAKDGSVVREIVYWPEIPASIVETAQRLSSLLSSASWRAQVLAAAEASIAGFDESAIAVAIHHVPFPYRGAFKAYAVIDASVGAVKPHTVHLDESGRAVVFAHEHSSVTASSR